MSFFVTLLIYAVLFVLSDLLSPKPELEDAKPSGLGDFNFPTATEQRKVPLLWGTVKLSGPNVVWWGDLEQEAITKEVKTGLFSKEDQVIGFRYKIGMQLALCEGECDDLLRVWVDEDIVYDPVDGGDAAVTHGNDFTIDDEELFGGLDFGNGGFVGTFKFHAGTSTQAVSTYLSAFQKFPVVTGDTPAYRGFTYVAPSSERIYVGNSSSIKPMKWEVRRLPNGLALSGEQAVNTYDANIMNVVYEAMTNTDWGYGIDVADVDTANFTTAAITLHGEGNGFSMLLDRDEDVGDLIRRLEQQADMVLFQNPFTGKWQTKLARDDYDIDLVFQLTVDNVVEVVSYTQSTWEDTKNQVSVPFAQRDDEYKKTYGFAQDMANERIVGKKTPTQQAHPGCKDKTLANALAWRSLRTLSQPLIAMTIICDRSVYGQLPGNVMAFTDPDYNAVKLPVRIQSIDYGSLFDGKIRMRIVQDVFRAAVGSFADPPGSGWEPPSDTLVPFPADEQLVFEAPRAFTLRDSGSTLPETDKVWATGRRQGPEVSFRIRTRNAPGAPAGVYAINGQAFAFVKIGNLLSAIDENGAYPMTTITVAPLPDTQGGILNAFPTILDIVELGTELNSLVYVDGEFMLVTSASTNAGNIDMSSVYRGVCDSTQKSHASGTDVFLIFVGGGMCTSAFPAGDNVDVLLTPRSSSDEVTEGAANLVQIALDNRTRRPYAPSEFRLNSVRLDLLNVSLTGSGSGEAIGVLVDQINRRDFRATDEILQLGNDASTIATDYPTANTTTHSLVVKNGGTDLVVQSIGTGVSGTVTQLDILDALDETTLPANLVFGVRAHHLFETVAYDSIVDCEVDSTLNSPFVGEHAFGSLVNGEASNGSSTLYAVQVGDDTTDHTLTLSTSFTVGDVQYRINAGAWTTYIAAGGTVGAIPNASLTVADTIEIRHQSSDAATKKLATFTVGASTRGYAVLTT